MFEKFTDKARKVMSLAQDEARNLGQMYVGTEHLLLALIREGEGVAAKAGESEHETGLGIDVYVKYYAGNGFLKSEAGQYVNKYCGDFGFIIRYPLLKEKETGFSYEPWHIRYVGLPHSRIIAEKSVSLEEYIESLELDCAYSYGDYIITRQDGEKVIAPSEYESVTVSPDNLGNLIFTFKIK